MAHAVIHAENMSRFLKNATFPILIVVVLAFFAQRFLGQSDEKPKPNFGQFLTQVENGQVKSVTIKTQGQHLRRHADRRQDEVRDGLPRQLRAAVDPPPAEERRRALCQRQGRLELGFAADLHPALHPAACVLDIPHELCAGWRLACHELREIPGQATVGRLAQSHVPRRGRSRRGRRGAARDQGVPREPQEVPGARRAHPQGRAALRPARHRQDAAGACGRRRGRRAVLLDLRLRLRRDVRRRGRVTSARPVRAGQAELSLHHLHGRDRRSRAAPRRGSRRRPRRARADAEPAAGRDGRLRDEGQHHPDRRHEPARHPRPGAAAPGPLRPPGRRRPAGPQGPRPDPRGAHARQAARQGDRPRQPRGPDARLHGRGPGEPGERGGPARGPRQQARDHPARAGRGHHARDRGSREEDPRDG